MTHVLVPRLSVGEALARLTEIETQLRRGVAAVELVSEEPGPAIANPTEGRAATESDLRHWRSGVLEAMGSVVTGSATENALHSMRLGQVVEDVVSPSPSDASHDGTWSFLSLMLFPDVLALRWPAPSTDGELPRDRWIGRQAGRDRNYLKLAWRRWQILGSVMAETGDPFGEDEFGALLERSAVARNPRLVQFAAREVASYRGRLGRNDFTRALMRGVTALTGPLQLDILQDEELQSHVRAVAFAIDPESVDRGA